MLEFPDVLLLALAEGLLEAEGDSVLFPEAELERVALAEPDSEAVEDTDGLALLLSVLLPVAVVLCVALTEADTEALALTDGLALLLTEPL